MLYAAAEIPHYWRFEITSFRGRLPAEDLPVLFAHSFGSAESYELTNRASAGDVVTLKAPFDITLDPATLLP